ncbi:sphingosine-1-phosphate lyase-like [Oppia nitens]|uniref:sphingosine-1-phosphate lyase-like n=1 Tax=Oppia nitens TaxID=1686743 RepID=UPI0023DC0FBA|nr:sphingosine-1-phosphate lyase-like [Oppia nitens]
MTIFSKLVSLDAKWPSDVLTSVSVNRAKLELIGASVLATVAVIKLYDLYDNDMLNFKTLKEKSFRLLICLPGVRGIAEKQLADVDNTISKTIQKMYNSQVFLSDLPQTGLSDEHILRELSDYSHIGKVDWQMGRASGTVYCDGNRKLNDLMTKVYDKTAYTNPLHPDVFPGINKMEAEIVRMVCNLFNGNNDSCGTLTCGGTESIILAVKAARDYGREAKGITRSEIVVPVTAHAAFQKAAQLLNIRIKFIDSDPISYKVDIKSMRRAITSNTVLLVGSACNYPHGIIDDIKSIAELGLKYSIPVHVDSCLGGFLVPFMRAAGYPIPSVDFSVAGVTSISADTHKYGYAPKGSSVIMYAHKKYRKHQFSVQTDWPGGIYATPTLAGSRCGANIANCWATLLSFGFDGYVEATKKIMKTQRFLKEELSKIDGIYIIGDPLMSVIAIKSDRFNIFRLSDKLSEMGWSLNPLQFPSAVHICLTLMHTKPEVVDSFLKDIKTVVNECLLTPKDNTGGLGVIYGMAQSLPDRSLVTDIASHYIDGIYTTEWSQTNGK